MILRVGYPKLPFHSYVHSMLHAIYGIRLCLFLVAREAFIPYFRQIRERIETNAPPSRLQRTPFIISCGFLYAFMSCPLLITASLPAFPVGTKMYKIMNILLSITSFGLALQIIGDTHKSFGKLRGEGLIKTGRYHLNIFCFVLILGIFFVIFHLTPSYHYSGVYSVFRHPNYTGELILWTFSTLTALFAAIGGCIANGHKWSLGLISLMFASILGNLGIVFILCQATNGLEKRQAEKYGDEFAKWSKSTTAGLTLSRWRK